MAATQQGEWKLDINVLDGKNLKNTEWIGKQDPFVELVYGSNKFRTRVLRHGGVNPVFNKKFVALVIAGCQEISVEVRNDHSLYDNLIGRGTVLLDKVLACGYDDRCWPLQTKKGEDAGALRLILHTRKVARRSPSAQTEHQSKVALIGSALKKLVKGKNKASENKGEGEEGEGEEEEEEEEDEEEEDEDDDDDDDEIEFDF
ncbi:hypothetical protein SELMODRAFT_416325 [Selaginella moellendorffii]|uniref:C2 domain-containing protein n=1 Tax=Selaginella moellendorffii TaxID=88036 RepID=D8RYX7_SELML|nr:hypothetical protein SELMODRAFT_416325 [Selaginella moellendorffii]